MGKVYSEWNKLGCRGDGSYIADEILDEIQERTFFMYVLDAPRDVINRSYIFNRMQGVDLAFALEGEKPTPNTAMQQGASPTLETSA